MLLENILCLVFIEVYFCTTSYFSLIYHTGIVVTRARGCIFYRLFFKTNRSILCLLCWPCWAIGYLIKIWDAFFLFQLHCLHFYFSRGLSILFLLNTGARSSLCYTSWILPFCAELGDICWCCFSMGIWIFKHAFTTSRKILPWWQPISGLHFGWPDIIMGV